MKSRKFGFVAILLIAIFILAACGDDARFIGRWVLWVGEPSKIGTQVYDFRRSGEGVWSDGRQAAHGFHEIPITWNVDGDRLEIFFGGQLVASTYYFNFEDDNTLIIRGIDWPEGTGSILTRLEN
ncbi:MAG: hypothetical protein FWC76_07210 [Defluviitaleaceae bacterium]|nr:hypothetical protein [Defluviitaleaceae bacterium]